MRHCTTGPGLLVAREIALSHAGATGAADSPIGGGRLVITAPIPTG